MIKTYNKVRLRDYLAAVVTKELRRFKLGLGLDIDPNSITYVGTQNKKDHEFVCVYDVYTENKIVRLYISPRVGLTEQIGTLTAANEVDEKVTYRLWLNIDQHLFDMSAIGIPVKDPYYAWRCPNIDLYLFEIGAIEHENVLTAILQENGGFIYLEDSLVDTASESFIWDTEAAIRDAEIIPPDKYKPFLVPAIHPYVIPLGGTYEERGAVVMDNLSEVAEVTVNILGEVNTLVEGTYVIKYQATDRAGNYLETSRTIIVKEPSPVIELYGDDPFYMPVNTYFFDPGGLAWDFDGVPLRLTQTNNINTEIPGTYSMTYSVIDSENRVATKERAVIVQ